eukprot:2459194-Pyramimonas_sp.AAC.1
MSEGCRRRQDEMDLEWGLDEVCDPASRGTSRRSERALILAYSNAFYCTCTAPFRIEARRSSASSSSAFPGPWTFYWLLLGHL